MDQDDAHDGRLLFGKCHGSTNPAMLIIGAEDEEFENDIDPMVDDNCSHYQCIDLIKDRPTYLIIFLHHVILQFDAASVLCYLHGEMFKGVSIKDARRMFMDYFHTFLDRAAILRVSVPHEIAFELDRCRPDMLCEDGLKNIVKGMQKAMTLEIYGQLEDFRNKRMMGMTIGERELLELDSERLSDRVTFELKEKTFAEQLLPKIEEATSNTDDEKSTSVYNAVVTYMKYLGVRTKEPRALEKKRHFLMRRKGPTPKKDSEPVRPDEKKRKGIGTFLDLRRQTRNDPTSNADLRPEGVKAAIDRKNSSQASKSPLDAIGRHKSGGALPEGSEVAGASGSSHALSREDSEGDAAHPLTNLRPGNENQSFPDSIDVGSRTGPSSEQVSGGEHGPEEGGESESVEPGGSGGPDSQQSFLPPQSEDNWPRVSELEADPPSWRQLISSENLLRLKKSEVKRQEVINELFITEHAHVRMLKVLFEIFYQRMLSDKILTHDELQSIFPSLEDLIEVHASFYENLKKIREDNGYLVTEIGTVLLSRFHGTEGDWFKKLASRFCSLQSFALELIKVKHRKDPRFSQFIQDAESNPQCRRLQLKDIIPIEMQRLTKYPLLLENIAKSTDELKEKHKVQQAAECCRNILKDVNQEVRETENLRRLHDYQKRLDISNLRQSSDQGVADFKNFDLTVRRMVHEGPLIWKLTKEKAIEVHVLLLDESLLLMQKVDDKMVLKCHGKNSMGMTEGKQMLWPIIKLGSVLARDVATDRKAFFVLFQTETGAQIYELVAQTVSERRNWCEKILSTQEALKLQRPSMMGRNSLVPPLASVPLSPTMSYREPLLNSENGFSTRDRINSELTAKESDGVSQDSGTGELSVDDRPGTESPGQILADLLKANDVDLAKLASGSSEHFADQALEDVHTMKRALNRSKRASKESSSLPLQPLGEAGHDPSPSPRASLADPNGNESREEGGTEAEREKEPGPVEGEQAMGPAQSEGDNANERVETESMEESTEGQGDVEEQEGRVKGTAEDLHAKLQLSESPGGPTSSEGETDSSGAPIVLSLDQAEEMERKMNSLLVKIQHLKAMEEEYHRLRQALVNLSILPRNSPGSCRRVSGERW